jgi:putative ABC transport system ATP-binding protein
MPLLYLSFELPKIILNQAIGGKPSDFPRVILGLSFDQFSYLLTLCAVLFVLVLGAGAVRYSMRTFKGVIGEKLLSRLRLDLYNQILRFPLARLRRVTGGEIIAMSTAEAEPISKYMGQAVANPTLHGGTLITAMVFLFAQDLILGFAAIALFPVQAWLIPIMQRKINVANRGRIESTRRFAAHVSESLQGLKEIRANHTVAFERATLTDRLGAIYLRGREIYSRSSFLIFTNYFFNHLTPFLFYSIGGVLVLQGDLTIGALVAVIAAFRETAGPWNELLESYQDLQENRLKYAALVENFDLKEDVSTQPVPTVRPGDGPLELKSVAVQEDGVQRIDGATLALSIPGMTAITGTADSGKSELAELLAGLRQPDQGQVLIGGVNMTDLSAETLGRAIAYADAQSFVFSGSWFDALVYGLKRPPEAAADPGTQEEWLDYDQAGTADAAGLRVKIRRVLDITGLADEVRAQGLRGGVTADVDDEFAAKLLIARRTFRESVAGEVWSQGIEYFDADRFIDNATLAENLLFGRPLDDTLSVYCLADVTEVMAVVERNGLGELLIDMGREASATILELFQTIPAGDERLQRLSLITPEDFPIYQAILARHDGKPAQEIIGDDRRRLLSVAFQLAPAHQRLGLVDDEFRTRLVAARKDFMTNVAPSLSDKLDPFDPDMVTANITVQCNLLYGRLDKRDNRFWTEIRAAMAAALDAAGLGEEIMALGLETSVGTAGGLLSSEQKQRLAVARGLLKRPRVLVLNEALSALDVDDQVSLIRRLAAATPRLGVIWVGVVPEDAKDSFDTICVMKKGRFDDAAAAQVSAPSDGTADDAADASRDTIKAEAHFLASIPALANVRNDTLRLMAYAAERRHFEPGDALIREGEKSVDVYVILEGAAEVTVGVGSRVVGTAGPGAFMGEVAAIAGLPRTATVTATEPVTALALSRDVFLDLVQRDDGLGRALLRDMAGRVVALAGELSAVQTR